MVTSDPSGHVTGAGVRLFVRWCGREPAFAPLASCRRVGDPAKSDLERLKKRPHV